MPTCLSEQFKEVFKEQARVHIRDCLISCGRLTSEARRKDEKDEGKARRTFHASSDDRTLLRLLGRLIHNFYSGITHAQIMKEAFGCLGD